MKTTCSLLLLALASVMAAGQSFNCDLDVGSGRPDIGDGAPSAAFPGAAGQSGYWNRLDAAGPINPTTLIGLDGFPTSATIQAFRSGGVLYGGYNNPNLSGDFRLLMADGVDVGAPIRYVFSGFRPGAYQLFTYSADAAGRLDNLFVSVPGSTTAPQTVTGPMGADTFTLGEDYCVHNLLLVGTSFEIDVNSNGLPPDPEVHGFQILQVVPEPATAPVLALGLAACLLLPRSQPRGACSS